MRYFPKIFTQSKKIDPLGELDIREEYIGLRFNLKIPAKFKHRYKLYDDQDGANLRNSEKMVLIFSSLIPSQKDNIYFQQYTVFCPESDSKTKDFTRIELWYEVIDDQVKRIDLKVKGLQSLRCED